jgi:hypothetical protein
MKALLFLTLYAFTAQGIDEKNCAVIIVKNTDRIEYEDIIDVIFWEDQFEYSVSNCLALPLSKELPRYDCLDISDILFGDDLEDCGIDTEGSPSPEPEDK